MGNGVSRNVWFKMHSPHTMKNAMKRNARNLGRGHLLLMSVWLWDPERLDSICSISKNEWWQWFWSNALMLAIKLSHPSPRSLSLSHFVFFADSVQECPRNCHGNGECNSGVCHCFPGFHGMDCSKGISCMQMCFFCRKKKRKKNRFHRLIRRAAGTFGLHAASRED